MKTLFKSLKITLVFCVFFSVFYILILWLFAQVAGPNKGNAEVATLDGKVVGAAAFAAIFRESCILQAQFGGDLDDLVEALAFAEAEPQYPKTMGGRVWWREIWKEKGYRIQQNVVSGHFRLLDRENRRLMASFTLERVMERIKEELQ